MSVHGLLFATSFEHTPTAHNLSAAKKTQSIFCPIISRASDNHETALQSSEEISALSVSEHVQPPLRRTAFCPCS